jgi:hypothetical protein
MARGGTFGARGGSFHVDDSGQKALFRHYEPKQLDRVFTASAGAGARAIAKTMQSAAPVGQSKRQGQFYRERGWGHGMLKASIKARKIRKRGINRNVIGYVVGPGGPAGFTRHWVTGGVRPHRIGKVQHPGHTPDPWVERVAPAASAAGERASDAVIRKHVNNIPRT